MRALFYLGHPAHFHLCKNLIKDFESKGYAVQVVIRTKDILEDLCRDQSWNYINVLPQYRKRNTLSFIWSYLKKYIRISKIIRKFKPTILLGSEPSLAHLGKIFRIQSLIFSEDDTHVIPKFAKIAYPFVDYILSPKSCDLGKWSYKKIEYNGFQKLAYLAPGVFQPRKELLGKMGEEDYFILRLAELSAYHDSNISGINKKIALKIIDLLEPFGKVYITSETPLDADLEKYRLHLDPHLIHHALYYANLYIGDSQSMAVETALLGTPGIRFNDFVGKIGVLNELENDYQLSYGIKTDQEEELYAKVYEIASKKDIYRQEFKEKYNRLINEKINVISFFSWLIENLPESREILKKNPDYQSTFK